MTKRESSDGLPRVDGEYMFGDGYRYGRIHYSGENSDVREGGMERGREGWRVGGRERKKKRRRGRRKQGDKGENLRRGCGNPMGEYSPSKTLSLSLS